MNFVVAVDGSKESDHTVKYASNVASSMDADMIIVHSVTPEIYSEDGDILIEDMSDAEARAEGILDKAQRLAEKEGLSVETELLYGDPADSITEFVDENGFDAIFVGHRGLKQKSADLMGSVAQEIVRRASVPVTVVR